MSYAFFHIRAVDPRADTERLNAFLASHVVLQVERQFVADGGNSFWSICISTAEVEAVGETKGAKPRNRKGVDYREVLSPAHFAIYARLRTLRNGMAEEQGTPPYAIFTNEQLATMARLETIDHAALAAIEGVGEKRLALYADPFLAELERANA